MDAVKIDALGLVLGIGYTSPRQQVYRAHPMRDGRAWSFTMTPVQGYGWACEITWRAVAVCSDFAESPNDAYDEAKELAHELIPTMYAELFAWEAQVYRERVKERHGDVKLTEDEEAVY
jgi:hypothetical protein